MAEIDHSVYFGVMNEISADSLEWATAESSSGDLSGSGSGDLSGSGTGYTGNVDWATGGTTSIEGNTQYEKASLIHTTGDHTKRGLAKGVNTWTDWHLIAASRPEIVPPEPYTNYVELPGRHGKLDLSEYLTGYPVYRNRSGSLQFYAANGYGFWAERYNQINNFLHGKRLFMVLYDEPQYFYTGRFKVRQYSSDGNTNWSTIQIDYELDPFKFVLPRDSFDQYWDRFLLDDLHEYQFINQIDASKNLTFNIPGYMNGFMVDAFLVSDNGMVNITLNDIYTISINRSSGSTPTKTGVLGPVNTPFNTVKVSGVGTVNLVCWGGHL